MGTPQRPVPVPTEDTRPYWDAARRHELHLPFCSRCARYAAPSRTRCDVCREEISTWRRVDGAGVIWSYCVTHIEVVAGYEPPYVVASVELRAAPNVRILANVLGSDPDEIAIGKEVVLVFEDRDAVSLPQFRLARSGPPR